MSRERPASVSKLSVQVRTFVILEHLTCTQTELQPCFLLVFCIVTTPKTAGIPEGSAGRQSVCGSDDHEVRQSERLAERQSKIFLFAPCG